MTWFTDSPFERMMREVPKGTATGACAAESCPQRTSLLRLRAVRRDLRPPLLPRP